MVAGARALKIPSGATVREVSELLGVGSSEIIKALMGYGEMVTITQTLSDEAIEVLAGDFKRKVEIMSAAEEAPAEVACRRQPKT